MPHYKSLMKTKESFCKNHGNSIEKKINLSKKYMKCNNQITIHVCGIL